MDFKELYQKYLQGTCTPEEKEFVEKRLHEAKEVLENFETKTEDQVKEIETDEIVKLKKKFNYKLSIKIGLISIISFALLFVILLLTHTFISLSHANSLIDKTINEYQETAITHSLNYLNEKENKSFRKEDIRELEKDKEFIRGFYPSNSYYEYEYEFKVGMYEVKFVYDTRLKDYSIFYELD